MLSSATDPLFKCSRRGQSRELILSWLGKSICRGELRESLYCAAELDLSGWSLFLWKRLFWIGWAHIGLANPLVPMSLLDLYERWLQTLKQLDYKPEKSAGCVKARCIIMLAVNWLTQEKKNQLILHCSTACILETTGCLTDDDWQQKLGTNHKLKISLTGLRLNSCPAESKAIVCLCRSMLENDEDRATRMVNLLYIWGKSKLIWVAMKKLCDVNAGELFGWAEIFINSYQKVWTFCLLENKVSADGDAAEITSDFSDPDSNNIVNKERLPLFQIILLMIPGRNFRFMFPTGIKSNSLSEDRIRVWRNKAADIYAANHVKIVMPDYVCDKNTKAGSLRGKGVEDYLNTALRVTNFASGVPDPFAYYDRSHRELIESEKRYGNSNTIKDALIRLQTSGAIQDGLTSLHPRDYIEKLNLDTLESKKRKNEKVVGTTTTPPIPKRFQQQQQLESPHKTHLDKVFKHSSPALSSSSGYYANYRGHHVLVDGPFSSNKLRSHLTAIHTIKQLFHGIDADVKKSHHSLHLLAKPLCVQLQLTNSETGFFNLTKIPWDQLQDPNNNNNNDEAESDDGMYMECNESPEIVSITPTIMDQEDRPEVHIRFLSLVAFRYTFWINCLATDDILLNTTSGDIYSLREREMTIGKPPQWKQLLPMEWSRYAWENYLKKKIFKQNPLIMQIMQQRCFRWKQILEVPDVVQAVFKPLHIGIEPYLENLNQLTNGGSQAWTKIGIFC